MSENIKVTNDIISWLPNLKRFKNREPAICPECGSKDIRIIHEKYEGNEGFVIFECLECETVARLSRIKF